MTNPPNSKVHETKGNKRERTSRKPEPTTFSAARTHLASMLKNTANTPPCSHESLFHMFNVVGTKLNKSKSLQSITVSPSLGMLELFLITPMETFLAFNLPGICGSLKERKSKLVSNDDLVEEAIPKLITAKELTNECGSVARYLHELACPNASEVNVAAEWFDAEPEESGAVRVTIEVFEEFLTRLNKLEEKIIPCWLCKITHGSHAFLVESIKGNARLYQSWQTKYSLATCLDSKKNKRRKTSEVLRDLYNAIVKKNEKVMLALFDAHLTRGLENKKDEKTGLSATTARDKLDMSTVTLVLTYHRDHTASWLVTSRISARVDRNRSIWDKWSKTNFFKVPEYNDQTILNGPEKKT